MKYRQFKGVKVQSDYSVHFYLPYPTTTETVIKRIRGLKIHGYKIVEEDVKHSRVKAASMCSDTVEGPLEGDFDIKTPGETEYILSVRRIVDTRLTVEMDENTQFSELMSMLDLVIGQPRKPKVSLKGKK
jgi:hypothetical protein